MNLLLDTNVISELRRRKPDERVVRFIQERPIEELFTSLIVLAEIRAGIELAEKPEGKVEMSWWLENEIRPMFSGRVLGISEETVVLWRLIVARGRKVGRVYSEPDLLLAVSAMQHGFGLVTRNVKDFVGLDVPIINPWDGPLS